MSDANRSNRDVNCYLLAVLGVCALTLTGLTACSKKIDSTANNEPTYAQYPRVDFNRLAAEHFLPLFWREDSNKDGALQPDELAVLWGFGASANQSERSHWVDAQQQFTAQFAQAYQSLASTAPSSDNAEQQRLQLVRDELAQGRTTLVETDLSKDSAATVAMVKHLLNAAQAIERIYAQQKGVADMANQIAMQDSASRMLFYRNQSPFCVAPKTENNPACSALPDKPAQIVGLYPANLQSDTKFCVTLEKAGNAKQLMDHFSVVVDAADNVKEGFKAVPYTQAYQADMQSVAAELDAAAKELPADEPAFKSYLTAAAQAFRDNDWEPANRAWVAMNATNSRWYARIAPDEVYYDPCAWKAGFALQLARINPESLVWQQKLDPLKAEMESTLAALAGKPYQARAVQFKLPDFIDVVINAGDQRSPHGATIGQSLPNWGPVAAAGGRTVAMTNLYTDADSQSQMTTQMASLFCAATNARATPSSKESLIASLLHEAAHNLGPSHEYRVNGQEDDVAFGGTLASTLEELKAQTSSMFLTDWLGGKGIFTSTEVEEIQLHNIAWGFGHISRGMYASDGTPRNYSQLAAIQVGSFITAGALNWNADERAANGADQGCLAIDFKKLPAAVNALETRVLQIKARADKADAEKLKASYVDAQDEFAKVKGIIAERWLRAPKATFVYSLRY